MTRKAAGPLIGIVALSVGGLLLTLIMGWRPLLGLDLQGGVSVVLQPSEPVEDDAQLEQAISIIRRRVDALGVAEPEIARQGDNVIVQLPGVDDQERALRLVGQTAVLRFRPVVDVLGPGGGLANQLQIPSPDSSDGGDTEEEGLGPIGSGEQALGARQTTTTVATDDADAPATDGEPSETLDLSEFFGEEITPPEERFEDSVVVLPQTDADGFEVARYRLGPTLYTGETLAGATAAVNNISEWLVEVEFKVGPEGTDIVSPQTSKCWAGTREFQTGECPTGRMAIVLDGEVISAPTVNTDFPDGSGVITGAFEQQEADDLATALRFGALPIELEALQSQEISASLGQDALRAGIIAGLVGLVLVAIYIISYYKVLGIVAMLSLVLSSALLWAIISWLGNQYGLALTLAGVTGIVVSIGVSVDSNIVYFENLKDDLRTGRVLQSSVDRAFKSSFSTIVKADVASLIGAGLLYWLTVGPVRGFALYLGLATMLDLVASYFFLRPAVQLLASSAKVEEKPSILGLPEIGSGAGVTP